MDINNLITSGKLEDIYGNDTSIISYQKERITRAVGNYETQFGKCEDLHIFSAAGRSEIGGNHTDHQRGQVLAASLNIDSLAIASAVSENVITLHSEGYDTFKIDLAALDTDKSGGDTAALIRGVVAGFIKKG